MPNYSLERFNPIDHPLAVFIGTLPGGQLLITVYEDHAEAAFRAHETDTWSPPQQLERLGFY